jgi:hypothetical protein
MKYFRKRSIIAIALVISLIIAHSAFAAEEGQKGFFARLWDRFQAWRAKAVSSVSLESSSGPSKKVDASSDEGIPVPEGEGGSKYEYVEGVEEILLTKDSMIEEIDVQLRAYPEVIGEIEGLSRKMSMMDGESHYYYGPPNTIPLKLKDLQGNVLYELLARIRAEAARVNRAEKAGAPGERVPEAGVPPREGVPGAPEEEAPEEVEREEIPLPDEGMIEVIESRLESYSEIVDVIPGLSSKKTAEGETAYYFETKDHGPIKLNELGKKDLDFLYIRVIAEAVRINNERLMMQLQAQEMVRRTIMQAPKTPPVIPAQPPRVTLPPPMPQRPAPPPPQPVRPPAPPPRR